MTQVSLAAECVSLMIGYIAFKKKSISASGFIALAIITGLFNFLGYTSLLCIQFYMFASSSFLTKLKAAQKKEFEKIVAKTGPRDYRQAIANLGVSTVCMLLYYYTGKEFFLAGFVGSVAAANADSWASEIGGLSKSKPFMITNFRRVEKGISGGVTLLGTVGGIAGSAFIVALTALTCHFFKIETGTNLLTASFIAGVLGLIIDSLLGAAFQALYTNPLSREVTEKETHGNLLIKGIRLINNDVVNLAMTFLSALLAALLFLIIS